MITYNKNFSLFLSSCNKKLKHKKYFCAPVVHRSANVRTSYGLPIFKSVCLKIVKLYRTVCIRHEVMYFGLDPVRDPGYKAELRIYKLRVRILSEGEIPSRSTRPSMPHDGWYGTQVPVIVGVWWFVIYLVSFLRRSVKLTGVLNDWSVLTNISVSNWQLIPMLHSVSDLMDEWPLDTICWINGNEKMRLSKDELMNLSCITM